MDKDNFIKYYRVFRNDTAVTEISTNDFKPVKLKHFRQKDPSKSQTGMLDPSPQMYFLPAGEALFYGYTDKVQAMEMAKAGSLKYIGLLIRRAEQSIAELKQYRNDHYNDLNINLLDDNIRKLETELNIK